MEKFLIAGLGNPGDEYAETRHNIGFRIAERLAAHAGARFTAGRYAQVCTLKHRGRQLIVIKPDTYVNASGKAIRYWMQKEKIDKERVIVLVDELALPFGKLRIGPRGSDGGHNGLKSIQEEIGTVDYPRLRFGIGNEFRKGGQVDYVLGRWEEEELKHLDERIELAAKAVQHFAAAGLQHAMNEYNNK
jgi:PTH1 family peptidyl-tRNA hydrolase